MRPLSNLLSTSPYSQLDALWCHLIQRRYTSDLAHLPVHGNLQSAAWFETHVLSTVWSIAVCAEVLMEL